MRRWGVIVVGLLPVAFYPACSTFGDADEKDDVPSRVEAGAESGSDAPPSKDDASPGILDSGTPCTDGYDFCKVAGDGGTPPQNVLVYAEKTTYARTDTVVVFAFWQAPINSIHLRRGGVGGYCAGGAGVREVCAVGKGCNGWYGMRATLPAGDGLFKDAQPIDLNVLVNPNGPNACEGAIAVGKISITVN